MSRWALLLCCLALTANAADVAQLAPWLDSISAEDLREQIEQLPDASATDEQGRTLLHHAVCEAPQRLNLLLEAGVGPAVQDNSGATALHRFFRCGHDAEAARLDQVTAALLAAGAPLDSTDNTGRTPLHAAIAAMPEEDRSVDIHRDAAALMLARGAAPDSADNRGRTPLHLAAEKSSAALVRLLIDAGAAVDAATKAGETPLWLAAAGRHNLDVMEALLEAGADPARQPPEQPPAAQQAAASEAWRKVHLLLQLQPDTELTEKAAGATLARALWEDAPQPVAELLDDAGAEPDQLHEQGGGDLAWRLAELGRTTTLDWLLEHGFELNRLPESGYPPLYFASLPATEILLERDADPTLASAEDGTVLAAFIEPPPRFRQDAPHFTPEKVDRLLAAGYPVDLRDPQGKTALERAVAGDRLWLVQRLLKAGADPRLTSTDAPSVIPLALQHGRLPLIRALIRATDDFHRDHGRLLLNYIRNGGRDPAVAELLLVNEIPPDAIDDRGNTALLWAARRQAWPLVSLLLDYGADPMLTNATGCDLHCYRWQMPETLQARLDPESRETTSLLARPPADGPTPFFALAFAPALVLYILVLGWRLHHHRPLLRPGLVLLPVLAISLITATTLFYNCDPCLVPPRWQLAVTALATLVAYAALLWLMRDRSPVSSDHLQQ